MGTDASSPAGGGYVAPRHNSPLVKATALQHIDELTAIPGIVVIQAIKGTEPGNDYVNIYDVYELPGDKKPATRSQHDEPGLPFDIGSLKQLLYIEEAYQPRTMLHVYGRGGIEHMTVDKRCRCSPYSSCCPLDFTVRQGQEMIGKVDTDNCGNSCFGCWECCCLCTRTHKVLVGPARGSLVHKYSLKRNACCCGRVNNCCGDTRWRPNFFIDIVEPAGELVSTIQKIYAGGTNKYVLPFPRDATSVDRAMLLAGLLSLDIAFYDRAAQENARQYA